MQTSEEIDRMISVLDDLQKGECWIGYNAMQVLHGLDAAAGQKKAYEAGNTIWQLVFHISYWRKHLVKRLKNGSEMPFDGPDFQQADNPEHHSWDELLKDFDETYVLLRDTILGLDITQLNQTLSGEDVQYTYYKQVMGAMQHDAFHLGQIMVIRRMFGV